MKAICLIAAFAAIAIVPPASADEAVNPNFDFSGVREFYKIADILLRDVEPTDEQWAALFDTPGHAELRRREFEDDFLKMYIRAACKPSAKGEIARIQAKYDSGYFKWFTKAMFESLEYALVNREKILAAMEEFESYPYTREAVAALLPFLPEESVEGYPEVAFIIFNDSRGYTPVIMSFNLLVAERDELDEGMIARLRAEGHGPQWPHVLYFAHEFFHYYRDSKPEFREPEEDSPDAGTMWYLNQIANEGVADQINVTPLQTGDGVFAATRGESIRTEQAATPEALAGLDEILARIHDNPDQIDELGREIGRHIKRAGHPAGYFMSNVILKHFDRARLVGVARNPFRFFYLYNEAAKLDGVVPVFSDKAIALIKRMEEKYGI